VAQAIVFAAPQRTVCRGGRTSRGQGGHRHAYGRRGLALSVRTIGAVDPAVIIVGAGPAGLAVARELRRRGVTPVLLERRQVGASWAEAYEGLRLHTRTPAAALPGLPLTGTAGPFPTAEEMRRYLAAYAKRFGLDVREGVVVDEVARSDAGWRLSTAGGDLYADVLVVATGIRGTPTTPPLVGIDRFEGRLLHAAAFRNARDWAGLRVLVVGLGNTGKDVALAARRAGATVDVAVRDGAVMVPYPTPITQRTTTLWRHLPRRLAEGLLRRLRREPTLAGLGWPRGALLDAYPVVGLELLEAAERGEIGVRPAVLALSADGARFEGGAEGTYDVIVLATGYRPSLGLVARYVELDAQGWPLRPCVAGLHLVGYRYPTTESWLQALRREAPRVAREVVREVALRPRRPPPARRGDEVRAGASR
jgi:putative flavoprotein involved in K+ transport